MNETSHTSDPRLERLVEPFASEKRQLVMAAWVVAEATECFDSDCALQCLSILIDLDLDRHALAAALVVPALEREQLSATMLAERLGNEVCHLAEGAARMVLIEELHEQSRAHLHSDPEGLRKMLLAMVEDVRVVFVKLAQRLAVTRSIKHGPLEEKQRVARENLDIFAPLANRLGIWQLKWELEDLSLHALEPEVYQQIAGLLEEKRSEREAFIEAVLATLRQVLSTHSIEAEIAGRPKHIYSIWKKMKRKGVDFHQLYDIRAVRVLVDDIAQCYAVLGLVHGLWSPVPGEFDDYVANPKENGYRSLHTAVHGEGGKPFEVQIRTRDMHRESELGVAAHWRYKEGTGRDDAFERKLQWLRQLMSWGEESGGEEREFVERFKSEVFEERIYVFSPKGQVVDLPIGATALDFAYHIHTEVGHRCRGAKANGRIIPLHQPLNTGDRVEILTAREGEPSRDWINPHLHYLATARAREKVRLWFRAQDAEKNSAAGRAQLERELARLGLPIEHERLARRAHFQKVEEFYAALGRGDVNSAQLAGLLRELSPRPAPAEPPTRIGGPRQGHQPKPGAVEIEGVGNLLTQIAQCCRPAPGDQIGGYISQGQGVVIHRSDCANLLHLGREQPERIIEVQWSGQHDETYPVEIAVTAFDRKGLLRDVTAVFGDLKLNVLAVNTLTDERDFTANMTFTVAVTDIAVLGRLLDRLSALPNVREAKRKV